MSWFDEQLRQRMQADADVFDESFVKIAGAVMGKKLDAAMDDRRMTLDAMEEILSFYHAKTREVPESIKSRDDQLEYLLRPNGIMRRTVKLGEKWFQDAIGPMLGVRKADNSVVALLPKGVSHYCFLDRSTGKHVSVTKKNAAAFEDEAFVFYKPFPLEEIGMRELLHFMASCLSKADVVSATAAALAVTAIGLLLPYINSILFSDVLASGSMRFLITTAVFLLSATLSHHIATAVRGLLLSRSQTKLSVTVQAASMMRVLSLPPSFFKQYSAGDLSSRMEAIGRLCELISRSVLETGLTTLFSLIYFSQIVVYARALILPTAIVSGLTFLFSVASFFAQIKVSRKKLTLAAKASGMGFAMISGIQKIRLSGSEKRVFARWGELYAKSAELTYHPPRLLQLNGAISLALSLAGTLAIYYFAAKSEISVSDYYAFNTAYAMIAGAFLSLSSVALTIAEIRPVMEMAEPILTTLPEVALDKQVIERLSGGIELNHVSFGYQADQPKVIDNLSLKIRPGQYVAVVGKTGCGKSTLLRLLLGFEQPQQGAIYFDGKDLNKIDLRSLRRKIGVVMQDGKLFQGDIYANITVANPRLTLEDAWAAAETAGIADDIRQMPMGMATLLTEGSGGISGGQRQRLMIARAVVSKPRILMFDEATSALDNLTQKAVSDALDKLKCTRIVIAHRLSTIRNCDRILVLDSGKIMEDGDYETLIEKNGIFAELVQWQRIDIDEVE